MVDQNVVRIAAERILCDGLNPKTNAVYILDDIKNQENRQAVEDYILTNTEGV